jgi:hypothetical protein
MKRLPRRLDSRTSAPVKLFVCLRNEVMLNSLDQPALPTAKFNEAKSSAL